MPSRLSERPKILRASMPVLIFLAMLPVLGHLNVEQGVNPVLGKTLARAIFWSVFVVLLLLPFVTSIRHQLRRKAIVRDIMVLRRMSFSSI
jgi:hypothetical protein